MENKNDAMIGERFGRLTIVKFAGRNNDRKPTYLCSCECGGSKTVSVRPLRDGRTRSCGCIAREVLIKRNTTHGKRYKPEYNTWCDIKKRCYNENTSNYCDYGGRGIKVCDRWMNSFENFYEDVGPKPSRNYSIERIDNNKNYGPLNCRWATRKEQNWNKRSNLRFAYNGRDMLLRDIVTEYSNLSYAIVTDRLRKKWSLTRALNQPKGTRINK